MDRAASTTEEFEKTVSGRSAAGERTFEIALEQGGERLSVLPFRVLWRKRLHALAVGIDPKPGLAFALLLQMRVDPPGSERQ